MSKLFRRKNWNIRVALRLSDSELTVAVVDCAAKGKPGLLDFLQFQTRDQSELNAAIDSVRRHMRRKEWRNLQCNAVLDITQYQIVQTDPLDVPPEELNEALRWKLQDLVSMNLDDAVIQSFSHPGRRILYAAAAPKRAVARIVKLAESLELDLQCIDLPELCFRNYVDEYIGKDRGVAVVVLRKGAARILIYRESEMYFTRRLPIDINGLESIATDELILEIQRSIDYYERQMHQPPPAEIIMAGEWDLDSISEGVKLGFQQPVNVLRTGHARGAALELSIMVGCALGSEAA